MRWVLMLILLMPAVSPRAEMPASQGANASLPNAVRELMESLPANSGWRDMLEHGAKGDGIRHPWMDEMQREGVKLAAFTFEFTWSKNGRELTNWTLVEEQYFRDFDRARLIGGGPELGKIRASGLQGELEAVALTRAKGGDWFEYPTEERGTGYRFVELAENEWLPVGLSAFFGKYDPGTTPLMHAALLGDVARVKKLLSSGADVNAVAPDGSTALIYAATSDNPAAVEYLLGAGADVEAPMKGGGNALTAAVVTDHPESVRLLLRAGANPNSTNVEGESALSIATRRQFEKIVQLLREAGASQ